MAGQGSTSSSDSGSGGPPSGAPPPGAPPPGAPPPPDGVTRLGPDSGGKPPETPFTYREWSWSSESAARGGLPFLGVFLVVFGVLLFLQSVVPGTSFWSWLALAIGAASLIVYVSRRRAPGSGFLLWIGVILVAVGLPSLLVAAGLLPERDGWSTLFLGVALVVLGLVRRTRPGVPASVWIGGILAIIGLSETALLPNLGDYLLPIAIIGIGAALVLRAVAFRQTG